MDVRKFVLSYYTNATENFHINEVTHPKGALSLHIHDYFQIYYLKTGKLVHHLESSSATLHPGDVFIIPPSLAHYIEPSSKNLLFYSISFAPDFLVNIENSSKLIKDFIRYLTDLSFENVPPSFSLGSEDMIFTDVLIRQIMSEFSSEKTGKEAVIQSSVGLLLSIFARTYLEQKCESIKIKSDRETIMHCISYLNNHFSEKITLQETAKRTAMSKTTFCKAFYSVIGETFNSYLNRKRIENAASLMKKGESAAVAAALSGYSDFSTFYRNFKKALGVSPAEYLKSSRNS